MVSLFKELIQRQSKPMAPLLTDASPRLAPLPGIKAVLFDIYGTLLVSGSGDIGSQKQHLRARAFREASEASGLKIPNDPEDAVAALDEAIREDHAIRKQQGVAYPEVDIVEIWRRVLSKFARASAAVGQVTAAWGQRDFERFALEFELRSNPVWPMPDLVKTCEWLTNRGLTVGVISNAQFFTRLLFPALTGRSLPELGCEDQLAFFSYEHGQAKPGTYLFELANRRLTQRGIKSAETLFVGNDMLNDIATATACGFRTALFAGDQRSLRLRVEDTRVAGIEADIVITELCQLTTCLA